MIPDEDLFRNGVENIAQADALLLCWVASHWAGLVPQLDIVVAGLQTRAFLLGVLQFTNCV
jgi:hypothetical protein